VRHCHIDNSKLKLHEHETSESKVIDNLTTNKSDKFRKYEIRRHALEISTLIFFTPPVVKNFDEKLKVDNICHTTYFIVIFFMKRLKPSSNSQM